LFANPDILLFNQGQVSAEILDNKSLKDKTRIVVTTDKAKLKIADKIILIKGG
jgi:hypothetical protein